MRFVQLNQHLIVINVLSTKRHNASINLNTIIIRRMSRLEVFCSFSSAQCTFNINVCYFCKKSLFKSNKDDSRTEREIAVHDNASFADKLLSCLDSNYCLTLLNP